MASPLKVKVVSAEREVWAGSARMVVAKTVEGEIGVLAGHQPVLAMLSNGAVRITLEDGEKVTADAAGGFLSVENDTVTVVAGQAELV